MGDLNSLIVQRVILRAIKHNIREQKQLMGVKISLDFTRFNSERLASRWLSKSTLFKSK